MTNSFRKLLGSILTFFSFVTGKGPKMILTLEIDKVAPATYRAAALNQGQAVCEAGTYASIAEAIRAEAAAVPDGFAYFIEPRYQGFSAGTVTLQKAQTDASELADHLMQLGALAHDWH